MAWKKLIYFVFAVSLNPINFNVVTLSDTKLIETSLENREMHPWGDLRLPIVVIFYYDMPDKKKNRKPSNEASLCKKIEPCVDQFSN